jgi:flagellar biosynthesis protein FlhG
MDQAQSLREYMLRFNDKQQKNHSARVITITSGKGGVGKSNFTLNFALGLKAVGKKVIILDLDLSTANINILMGISPRYSLVDILYHGKHIWDVLEKGTRGIEYIAGGFNVSDLLKVDKQTLTFFWSQIQELQTHADYILLDTGAGVTKELMEFIVASDETIMITTPEPTSIADSYAILKNVSLYTKENPNFSLVVNRAQSFREVVETSRSMKNACTKFLGLELKLLGYVMEDTHVRQSVRSQIPFYTSYPNCPASKNIRELVYSYLPDVNETLSESTRGIRGFFEKILLGGNQRKGGRLW